MEGIFYALYEVNEKEEKRRVYTFNNPAAAHDMLEFIVQRDFMHPNLVVEEIDKDKKE